MNASAVRTEAGFTLVEVMVALMIFGMIAAAGVAILSFSVRAQGASTAKLDDVAAMNRTVAALTADLAQAVVRPARDEGGALLPAFVGDPGGVALVRGGWTNVDGLARPGLQKVQWRIDGGTLRRVGFPQVDGAQPMAAAPMLTGVRQGRFRFRFAGVWNDAWNGTVGAPLPQALDLELMRTDGTRWRAMALIGTGYVPTREGGDAGG